MKENKLTGLEELTTMENAILKTAESGNVIRTIGLCENLSETSKRNVQIAHSIRNARYSKIAAKIKYLQENQTFIPDYEKEALEEQISVLSWQADEDFHEYMTYLQNYLPGLKKLALERAKISQEQKKYPKQ